MNWIKKPIGNGMYVFNDEFKMEEPFLIGKCNENGHKIIFITNQGSQIGSSNTILFVDIISYIECKYEREMIDRMSFCSHEIDCIHPVNQSYEFNIKDFAKNGVFSLTTLDFDSTSTTKQNFKVDDNDVQVYFCIHRGLSSKVGDTPVKLDSAMLFEFEPTNDYSFLLRLWYIAKQFIRFLCYRKNINLAKVELSSPCQDGRHEQFATLYMLNEEENSELETLKKGRYIKQQYIEGYEGAILTDIAANLLYTRHLPNTFESGRHIDAARFVMITAAFEWEFHRSYPTGIPKDEQTIKVEQEASESIQKLIDSSSGKLKKKYKFLKKLITSDSLQNEIIKMGEDYNDIVGIFGNYIYRLNNEILNYTEMGERLAEQRNHYSHGDLDKEFIGLSLLDLIYLEYIIYAMQLKYYGIENKNIQKAIKDLFHLNVLVN